MMYFNSMGSDIIIKHTTLPIGTYVYTFRREIMFHILERSMVPFGHIEFDTEFMDKIIKYHVLQNKRIDFLEEILKKYDMMISTNETSIRLVNGKVEVAYRSYSSRQFIDCLIFNELDFLDAPLSIYELKFKLGIEAEIPHNNSDELLIMPKSLN